MRAVVADYAVNLQVPDIPGFRGLIDSDTPASALTRTGYDGKVRFAAARSPFDPL